MSTDLGVPLHDPLVSLELYVMCRFGIYYSQLLRVWDPYLNISYLNACTNTYILLHVLCSRKGDILKNYKNFLV